MSTHTWQVWMILWSVTQRQTGIIYGKQNFQGSIFSRALCLWLMCNRCTCSLHTLVQNRFSARTITVPHEHTQTHYSHIVLSVLFTARLPDHFVFTDQFYVHVLMWYDAVSPSPPLEHLLSQMKKAEFKRLWSNIWHIRTLKQCRHDNRV